MKHKPMIIYLPFAKWQFKKKKLHEICNIYNTVVQYGIDANIIKMIA